MPKMQPLISNLRIIKFFADSRKRQKTACQNKSCTADTVQLFAFELMNLA